MGYAIKDSGKLTFKNYLTLQEFENNTSNRIEMFSKDGDEILIIEKQILKEGEEELFNSFVGDIEIEQNVVERIDGERHKRTIKLKNMKFYSKESFYDCSNPTNEIIVFVSVKLLDVQWVDELLSRKAIKDKIDEVKSAIGHIRFENSNPEERFHFSLKKDKDLYKTLENERSLLLERLSHCREKEEFGTYKQIMNNLKEVCLLLGRFC